MKLTIYQIDAFAEKPFEGNPAAVVPLNYWLPDNVMQAIAEENNLSETAFFVPSGSHFHIRWFTPINEVTLCGHATLASAYVLFNELGYKKHKLLFESLSGVLTVTCDEDLFILDFPLQPPAKCEIPASLSKGLGKLPVECLANDDYLAVYEKEEDVLALVPDQQFLQQLDRRGVIVTAPSSEYDFVARFFAPKYGITEDPVTGSAFTQLAAYWSHKLGKNRLDARQVSARGGRVFCELQGDRVLISGTAVKYMEGSIEIEI